MTVREMLTKMKALIDAGEITYDTHVILGDDGFRDESVDPITCYELVPSGPCEYDWCEISWKKACELRDQKKSKKSYVNDVRVNTSSQWASAELGLVKKMKFADSTSRKGETCLAVVTAAK